MAKKTVTKKQKVVSNIQFTKSPTGRYALGYSAGDIIPVTTLGKEKSEELIEAGYATLIK